MYVDRMPVKAVLPRRELAEVLTDATGLPWEEVWDALHGYVMTVLTDWIPDALRRDERTQQDFVSYVMSEREKETAPVGGAAR